MPETTVTTLTVLDKHRHLVIHQGIKDGIEKADPNVQKRFDKALQNLADNCFSHGLFVKKLKGTHRKAILEARINQKERLLFEYAKQYCAKCEQLQSFKRVIDYVPDHDDVNRRKERFNLSLDKAIFENWEEVTTYEKRVESTGEGANKNSPGYDDFWLFNGGLLDDDHEQLDNGVEWYQTDDHSWILKEKGANEPMLLLSQAQAGFLTKPGPILINGTAGSGKTTLAVYRLIKMIKKQPDLRVLYVTYNPLLVNNARELAGKLASDLPSTDVTGQPGVFFATFQNLCKHLLRENKSGARGKNPDEDFNDFRGWYGDYLNRNKKRPRIEMSLVWDELRSVIRGSVPKKQGEEIEDFLERGMLSKEEYLELGKNESSLVREKRNDVYQYAEEYVKYLAAQKLNDEMALVFRVLQTIDQPLFDIVIADEIQDLTPLEIELLIRLTPTADKGQGLFLVGDLQQVINPSNFRWENVRNLMYSRGWLIPELDHLNFNFRNQASLVKLANQLLNLRVKAIGVYGDETIPQNPLTDGASSPGFCVTEDENMETALKLIGEGVHILVAKQDMRETLKIKLGTEFVYTVHEAKGIEFPNVLLWKLSESEQEVFSEYYKRDQRKEDQKSAIAHAYNYLYVALTRSKGQLVIYETKKDTYPWKLLKEKDLWDTIEPDNINQYLSVPSTAAEWIAQGEYFIKAEKYKQAIRCFENALEDRLVVSAKAQEAEYHDQYKVAAQYWESINEFRKAAVDWEKTGNHPEQSALCWEGINEWSSAALQWEKLPDWTRAGQTWKKAEKLAEAARCYRLAGQPHLAMQYEAMDAELSENYTLAAGKWEEIHAWEDAIRCYKTVGNLLAARRCEALSAEQNEEWAQAAQIWYELEDYSKALRLYQKVGMITDVAICQAKLFEIAENWADAAPIWENIQDWTNAAHCYNRCGKILESKICEARLAQQENRFFEAATVWESLKNWTEAGNCFKQSGDETSALRCLACSAEENHEWGDAGNIWEKLETWDKAIDCYQRASDSLSSQRCVAKSMEAGEHWLEAAAIWETLSAWARASAAHRNSGSEEQAVRCDALLLESDGKYIEAAQKWEWLGRWNEAIRCYSKSGNLDAERQCLARQAEFGGDWYKAAQIWESQLIWPKALRCFEQLGDMNQVQACQARHAVIENNWKLAAQIYQGIEEWELAAGYYQQAGNKQQSIMCRANAAVKKEDWSLAAELFEEIGYHLDAEKYYKLAGNIEAAYRNLALHAESQANWSSAAMNWIKIGQIERAGKCFETGKDWMKAARCYQKAGLEMDSHRCQALLAEGDQNWIQAADQWRAIKDWQRASSFYERAGKKKLSLYCLARYQEASQQWPLAGKTWLEMGELIESARCFRAGGNVQASFQLQAEFFEKRQNWKQAAHYWGRAEKWTQSVQCWEFAGYPYRAAVILRKMGDRKAMYALLIRESRYHGELWKTLKFYISSLRT